MRTHPLICILLLSAAAACGKEARPANVSEPILYSGICGGSAAAAAGSGLFVVADDETSQLRVYRRDRAGQPVQTLDLTAQLQPTHGDPEADIEGAARIGEKVFWITSHSRSHSGKEQPNRCRFFATTLSETNDTLRISFVGEPYKHLIRDLAASPALQSLNLAAASRLAPKARGGLNIEALCATPDDQLLIGFRNPIPNENALLVPLQNPEAVIAGQRPAFGAPIQLDLNGLGIRDMAYSEGRYIIIAGSYDGGGKSRLFSWSGGTEKPKQLKGVDLKSLNAEALIIYPDKGLHQIQLLSDDGTQGDRPCRELRPDARHFRSVWVSLDAKPAKKR